MFNATYQGITIFAEGVTVSRTPGITPNSVVLPYASDKTTFDAYADLVLDDGKTKLTFKGMWLDRWTAATAEPGHLELLDGRCRWKYAPRLNGEYNRPFENGMPRNEKTIRELAGLAADQLKVVGVQKIDLTALSSWKLYPHVNWEWTPPAEALQSLAAMAGCQIQLQIDGSVTLSQVGTGSLPTGNFSLEREEEGQRIAPRPQKLVVRGGRIIKEETVEGLVAVGQDTDGSIQLIDDLSYTPADGWSTVGFKMLQVSGSNEVLDLAEMSVFRWYRLPDNQLYQRPILSERVTTAEQEPPEEGGHPETANASGKLVRLVPKVEVKCGNLRRRDLSAAAAANSSSWEVCQPSEYTIDGKRGIVMFHDQMIAYQTTGDGFQPVQAAEVRITYAYESVSDDGSRDGNVSDADYYGYPWEDWTYDYGLIECANLVLYQINGTNQNRTELDKYAQSLIDRQMAAPAQPKSATYRVIGLTPITFNGMVQSVSYELSERGATTVVALCDDLAGRAQAPYVERLFVAATAATIRRVACDAAQANAEAPAGAGDSRVAVATPTASRRDIAAPGRAGILVKAEVDIPANSIVEFDGRDTTTGFMKVRKPATTDSCNVAFVEEPIASGKAGLAFEFGSHNVRVASGVAKGDRVGAVAGSWLAGKSNSGNAIVRDVFGAVTGGSNACLGFSQAAMSAAWQTFAALNVVVNLDGGSTVWSDAVYKRNAYVNSGPGSTAWTRQQAIAYLAFGYDPDTYMTTAMPADLSTQAIAVALLGMIHWSAYVNASPPGTPEVDLDWVTEAYYVDGASKVTWASQPAVDSTTNAQCVLWQTTRSKALGIGDLTDGENIGGWSSNNNPWLMSVLPWGVGGLSGARYGIRVRATIGDPVVENYQSNFAGISVLGPGGSGTVPRLMYLACGPNGWSGDGNPPALTPIA